MSLTIVAIAGVLLGFLCLLVGFFMDTQNAGSRRELKVVGKGPVRERRMKNIKRRAMGMKRKAA